jgi:phage/plasmid-like protein (TIGR03299 family)
MARPKLQALPAPANSDILEKSAETMDWLRNNIKVGFTGERGPAWWANATTKAGTWTLPEGSHFEGPVPLEEVRKLLDIKLVKGRVFVEYLDADGERQITTDESTEPIVNAATGRIFGYPSDGYRIHPYLETLSGFINKILHDEQAEVGSVGLLHHGGQAFLQAVLPEHYEVAGYGYTPYLLAVTSADQSRSTSHSTGVRGAVCDNTVNAAVRQALTRFAQKHTRNSVAKVQAARDALGIQLAQVAEDFHDTAEQLLDIDVSDEEFKRWLNMTTPLLDEDGKPKIGRSLTMAENKRDKLIQLTKDPKVQPWWGSAFGVLQLDNTYRTWGQTVRGAEGGRFERNLTNDANGITAAADREALDALAKVLKRPEPLAAAIA